MRLHRKLRIAALIFLRCLLVLLIAELTLRSTGFLFELYYERRAAGDIEKSAQTVRILFIGESTMFGLGAREGSPQGTLPQHLEKLLEMERPGVDFQCINKGIIGITTAHMLRYLKKKLIDYQPRIVVIQGGANRYWPSAVRLFSRTQDEKRGKFLYLVWAKVQSLRIFKMGRLLYDLVVAGRVDEENWGWFLTGPDHWLMDLSDAEVKGELLAMVRLVRSEGIDVVLCGYLQPSVRGANQILREVAADTGVAFCDNRKGLSEGGEKRLSGGTAIAKDLFSRDNWHPSGKGYHVMALNMLETMKENQLVPRGLAVETND